MIAAAFDQEDRGCNPVRSEATELGRLSVEQHKRAEGEREAKPETLRLLLGNELSHLLEHIDRTSAGKLGRPDITLPQRVAALIEPAKHFNRVLVRDIQDRGAWYELIKHLAGLVKARERRLDPLVVPTLPCPQRLFRALAKIEISFVR